MSTDISYSDKGSAATSTEITPADQLRAQHSRDEELSQEEFLRHEAARTKVAMAQSLEELKNKLRVSADLRKLTREHPLTAVAVAVAGGFAAATVLTPKRDESFKDKLSHLANSVQSVASTPPSAAENAQSVADQHPGLTGVVVSSLIGLARTTIENFIAASAEARARADEVADGQLTFDFADYGGERQA